MVMPYVKSMRPETWLLASLPIIIMSVVLSNLSFVSTFFWTGVLIFIYAIVILGACNMINEVFDIEMDKINKPHRPIVRGEITRKKAAAASFFLFLIGNIMALMMSFNMFLLALLFTFFGIAYSVPHLRFKDHYITSMITLAVGYGFIIPVTPWFLFGEWNSIIVWAIISMSFLWFFGSTNSKDFKDVDGDRKTGSNTLVVKINEKNTLKFMAISMAIIPIIMLVVFIYFNVLTIWHSLVSLPYILTLYAVSWLYKNYTKEKAFEWYKLTYFLYPSIFMFLAIGFLISGGV